MTTTPEQIAAGLSAELREALDYEERTYFETCQLNALGLVHMDIVKDAHGVLVDMRSRLTPLGEQVRNIIKDQPNDQ